ncbi:hypothetical protein K2173_024608 [Erythroxylum novogranatense]|uniref:Uncharacterized protein n=1 Tax=Erythroxylum novogranatense TaxID=1862640 RepID=A0AAV8SVM8_9ROSI|nr:hypothetical protein K2173_024608 [Erythroxylum novogranatense]
MEWPGSGAFTFYWQPPKEAPEKIKDLTGEPTSNTGTDDSLMNVEGLGTMVKSTGHTDATGFILSESLSLALIGWLKIRGYVNLCTFIDTSHVRLAFQRNMNRR